MSREWCFHSSSCWTQLKTELHPQDINEEKMDKMILMWNGYGSIIFMLIRLYMETFGQWRSDRQIGWFMESHADEPLAEEKQLEHGERKGNGWLTRISARPLHLFTFGDHAAGLSSRLFVLINLLVNCHTRYQLTNSVSTGELGPLVASLSPSCLTICRQNFKTKAQLPTKFLLFYSKYPPTTHFL